MPGPEMIFRSVSPLTFQSFGEIDTFHSFVLSPTFAGEQNSRCLVRPNLGVRIGQLSTMIPRVFERELLFQSLSPDRPLNGATNQSHSVAFANPANNM